MRLRIARRGGLMTVIAAAALMAGVAPASAAPGDGSAYGVRVGVTLLGAPAVTITPQPEADTAGPHHASLAEVNLPGILHAGAMDVNANRDHDTGAVDSNATLADLKLPVLAAAAGGAVSAEAVKATCHADQAGLHGDATIAGLKLGRLGNGSALAHPAKNSSITVGLAGVHIATITFNEQIKNADGSLTVNAVHLRLLGGVLHSVGSGDVVISSATCGPASLPIPMASGAGLWLGIGLLGAVAIPVGGVIYRKRRSALAS